MAILQDLIKQIDDPVLRERISLETDKLLKQKKFGLVFEEHLPECTPLYDVPIRVGSKVALKTGSVSDIYTVTNIEGENLICARRETHEIKSFKLDELVTVAEFGEPIYPNLKPIDSVENDPDGDLWHTLIEADNYHALQMLEYMYAGKVDCIYIDPPYNTGIRDWKYNNDYVDGSDQYRHSKWLSMMQKRLKIAKRLLSPSGCIFISIDDGEACSLKLLCDEIFDKFVAQIPWRKRTARSNVPFGISQNYESILCYANKDFMAGVKGKARKYYTSPDFPGKPWRFHDLTTQSTIKERPNCNFTIVNYKTGAKYPVNPMRCWGVTKDTFGEYYSQHRIIFPGDYDFLKISKPVLRYWKEDDDKKTGSDLGLLAVGTDLPDSVGMTQNGTKELTDIFYDKRFPFPKPIGLIKYLVSIATVKKPSALILDFFAGSGTTLHAVNFLNAEDGGHRRCIMVTNNEVSDEEAKTLANQGYHPGDDEWEKYGIARYVTWPRTVCSIEGNDINGNALKGNYISDIEIPKSYGFKANCAYFKLSFLDKTQVALGRQFRELLPVLWMKAGAVGKCPELENDETPMLILPKNKMAVLIDEIYYFEFNEEIHIHPEIQTIFIVTDSEIAYRTMIRSYDRKACYQLYRDYLDNFRINTGG